MYQYGKESVQFIFHDLNVALTNTKSLLNMTLYFERVLVLKNTVKYQLSRHL